MAQQKALAEINTFVAGLASDSSPLTYPDNSSKVDINMVLNLNGSRQRALGIDYEGGYIEVDSGVSNLEVVIHTYRWENVGGDPDKNIQCVQVGNKIQFFSMDELSISRSLIDERTFSTSPSNVKYSFTSVDGNLVIATGINLINIVTYNQSSNSFSYSTDSIKVRDFFGVDDVWNGTDLTVGLGLSVRPTTLTQTHRYNLKNQSFGTPRKMGNDEALGDPIGSFSATSGGKFPSNSDNVTSFLYPDANDEDDRTSDRYFAKDNIANPLGTMRAAQGYFIIDLLNRGTSRLAEAAKNQNIYPSLSNPVTSLPEDRTPGGATVVGEFSGRVFYGGFSGEVINGDSKSPKLSSYVAFSQLVRDPSTITQCYQEGDPTSSEAPDIIDTDGGFIRISNAFGIKAFVNLGSDLLVGASNGWWRIYGGNDTGFSATNYVVSKITDRGIRGAGSVVEAEDSVFYWSDDGIYNITKDQLGDWRSTNIIVNKIQRMYDDIPTEDKDICVGTYDSFQKTIRWVYYNNLTSDKKQKEIVLSVLLGAFYERHIEQFSDGFPKVVCNYKSNSFRLSQSTSVVTVGGVDVTSSGQLVTITKSTRASNMSLYESGYLVVTQTSPTIKYTFASYTDVEFRDWKSRDGVGLDAKSVLVTGQASGGDNIRQKQLPYIVVHMNRTEDGFEVVGGDMVPVNQSSCRMQVHWGWTDSANSNKWGMPQQVYRYKRHYFPDDMNSYDTGYETIVTKNKVRGRGRAIAIKFESEPYKEMHILGWSMLLAMNSNV